MPDNQTGKYVGAGAGAVVGGGAGAAIGGAVGNWVQKRLGKSNYKDAFVLYSYSENPKYRFSQQDGRWIVNGTEAGQMYAEASGESPDFWIDHGVEKGRLGYHGVVVSNGVAYDANRFSEDARGETGYYQGRNWKDVKVLGKGLTSQIITKTGEIIDKASTVEATKSDIAKYLIYGLLGYIVMKVLK